MPVRKSLHDGGWERQGGTSAGVGAAVAGSIADAAAARESWRLAGAAVGGNTTATTTATTTVTATTTGVAHGHGQGGLAIDSGSSRDSGPSRGPDSRGVFDDGTVHDHTPGPDGTAVTADDTSDDALELVLAQAVPEPVVVLAEPDSPTALDDEAR